MYQVITLYGDFEPWWFLDDWQNDITTEASFSSYHEALQEFDHLWQKSRQAHPYYHSRRDLLAVFWDDEDSSWCEDCSEPIQKYHSLLLLKDYQVLPFDKYMDYYEQANANSQNLSTCTIFLNPKKD